MTIKARDFLILGLLATCILSQIISTSTSAPSSTCVSTNTTIFTNIESNIGVSTLLNAPLTFGLNLVSGLNSILGNIVGNVASILPTVSVSTVGSTNITTTINAGVNVSIDLNTLPAGQVLNTVANVATVLPIIGGSVSGLTIPQVGVPCTTPTLLSGLTSNLLGTVTNLLGSTLSIASSFNVSSNVSSAIKKVYNLQGGYLEIDFDFKSSSVFIPSDASCLITIDDYPIYRVLASDLGKTIKIPLPVKIPKGQRSIGFLPLQGAVSASFAFLISNLLIYEKQIIDQLSSSLVANGGFEINTCSNNFCSWNFQNFVPTCVNGWNPSPEIKVVKAATANPVFINTWAVELDVSVNTCVVQTVNLKQGRNLLKFNWACRSNTDLSSNGLLVIVNRQLLKNITPVDYLLHTESLEFFNNNNGGQVELALCGAGESDGVGTLVDNIQFSYYDESNYKINKY